MNSKFSLAVLFFFFQAWTAQPQDFSLAVENIPDSLAVNSHAVVRLDKFIFEVKDLHRATLYHKKVVTLLNDKIRDQAEISIYYSPERTIRKVDGRKYDRNGNLIDKLKQKDIEDYSVYSESFFDDNRIKKFDLSYANYPYTYEFEYVREYKSLHDYPSWQPLSASHISVENAIFQVIIPAGQSFRYKEFNLPETGQITEEEDKRIYTWEVNNLKSIEKEKFMPSLYQYTPYVITAPDDFVFDDYQGNLSSWKSYGYWIFQLNEGRDKLSPEKQVEILKLVEGVPLRNEKTKILYDYLQKNTRYISIQLGIGGFQPFEADFVERYGYGDCKALTNYMQSLLSIVGIKSYYTLVRAGRNIPDIHVDFPSAQFNHAILCVPDEQDTIWLECTSQDNPFGYLGTFTGNRSVLIVSENGGTIARTPDYAGDINRQIRNVAIKLKPTGDAVADIRTEYSGLQYEYISPVLDAGYEEQQRWLYNHVDIPHFELLDFSFRQKKDLIPQAEENLILELPRFAHTTGKRLFLQPNLMNKQKKLSFPSKKRLYDIELRYSYIDIDTIDYELPQGYHLEFVPDPIEFESKFGEYSWKVIPLNNTLRFIRKIRSNRGVFPPDDYQKLVDFINRMADADNMKLVLVNKT